MAKALLLKLVFIICIHPQAQERTILNQHIALVDSIYTRVMKSYVEKDIPPQLFRSASDASLGTLDPWSNYMNAVEAKEFNFSMKAQFGGVGFSIGELHDAIVVKEISKNAPADKAGIRPGDLLLQVNGVSLNGKSLDEVIDLLRGDPGTSIRIKFLRPSTTETKEISTNRQLIQLPSVPYYGLLPGSNGYIRVTGETANTGEEVKKALLELKKNRDLNGLVLDLRGNTGGYMMQAIKVANFFVEKGKVAVSEKSWYSDTSYLFNEDPIDTKIPLVLLIDTQTISAGEILTGALQDHDRALLIGQKTFGKGMVQRMYNLPNDELLKLTTAYYYTPSGRCIQRREEGGARTREWSDTMKKIVHTAKGRALVSHDGIAPDIEMKMKGDPPVVKALLEWPQDHLFRFANDYILKHPHISAAANFRISDRDYDDFVTFLKKEDFRIPSESEKKLSELQKTLEKEGYSLALYAQVASIKEQLNKEKDNQFVIYRKEIKTILEGEIVAKLHYNWGRVENSLKDDEVVKKAVEVLSDWGKYGKLLER